ncbi:MAG TPA: hypothetical protein VGA12_03905 [Burkholderiales bacterium]|jgi:hypothetical protein
MTWNSRSSAAAQHERGTFRGIARQINNKRENTIPAASQAEGDARTPFNKN